MPSYKFEPLKIQAYLATPYVGDYGVPLDGILLATAMERHYGAPPAVAVGHVPDYDRNLVPLAIEDADTDHWFYRASFAAWSSYTEGVSQWVKRFNVLEAMEYYNLKRQVVINKGDYKAYLEPIYYRHAETLTWHVMGDYQAISDLLTDVHGIGKHRNEGWGAIKQWIIKRADNDYSLFDGDALMRPIPFDYVNEASILWMPKFMAYRPPYWAKVNEGHCYL